MGFKTVRVDIKYPKYTEAQKGDILVKSGTYKGTREGKFGTLHDFIQEDGQQVTLNSAGQLDWLLENHAPLGSKCNVIFQGKVKLTTGTFAGKEANQFELQVDDEAFTPPASKARPSDEPRLDAGPDIAL